MWVAAEVVDDPPGRYTQRSLRLNVIASKGRMLTGSSSIAHAMSTHSPSRSSNASRGPVDGDDFRADGPLATMPWRVLGKDSPGPRFARRRPVALRAGTTLRVEPVRVSSPPSSRVRRCPVRVDREVGYPRRRPRHLSRPLQARGRSRAAGPRASDGEGRRRPCSGDPEPLCRHRIDLPARGGEHEDQRTGRCGKGLEREHDPSKLPLLLDAGVHGRSACQ